MQILSKIPGRIRLKEDKVYKNEELSQVLDVYLRNLPGVRNSSVNSFIGTIVVYYEPEILDQEDLQSRITQVLDSDSPYLTYIHENYQEVLEEEYKLSLSKEKMLILGGIYLLLKVKHIFFGKFSPSRSLPVLAVAAVVAVFNGYPFFQRITKKLGEYFPSNPDKFLLGLGVVFTLLREGDGILFLFLKSFTDGIEANSRLQMKKVIWDNSPNPMDLVWYKEGKEDYLVPFKSLQIRDQVIFSKNDTILIDGKITQGEGMINCLYFSGQPEYRKLQQGDQVREGMVLISGQITVEITKLPERNPKADLILEDLEIAQKAKRQQEKSIYIASGLAVLGYAITGSFITSLAVFLVMNPAATQIALTSGVTNYLKLLLKNKMILRNVNTLEKILNTSKVIFDKTGTLTDGHLRIAKIDSLDENYANEDILQFGVQCEADRFYPVMATGEGVKEISNDEKITCIPVEVFSSHKTKEGTILVGTKEILAEHDIHVAEDEQLSGINLYVVKDQKPIGKIHIVEEVGAYVSEAMEQLRELGVNELAIISGDQNMNVQRVADQLQIKEYQGQLTKEEKAQYVEKERSVGPLMMVGDGVNDSGAMRSADISVSCNQANSQVVSSSDCILLEKDLTLVPKLMELTEESYRIIQRNVNFSWYYSILFGSIASFGYLTLFQAEALKTFNLINSVLNSGNISKLDCPALKEVFDPLPAELFDAWDQEKEERFLVHPSKSTLPSITV